MAAALGGWSLAAWWLGGWQAARLGPDGLPMGPLTGLLFLVVGLAEAALMRWPDSRGVRRVGLSTSLAALVLGALAALQWWRPFALPWDGWLVGPETHVGAMPLGRISPLAAVAFVLTGLALATQLPARLHWGVRRVAGLIASALAFGGGLEIVASQTAGTPAHYGGTVTPMAFVTALAFVGLNLGLLLKSLLDEPRLPWLGPPPPGEDRGVRRHEALALITLLILIASGGLFFLRREQSVARATAYVQLDAVVNLKAGQIAAWRSERLNEASGLLKAPALSRAVGELLARPRDVEARPEVLDWLEPLMGPQHYQSAFVYDAGGRLRLALPATASSTGSPPAKAFHKALVAAEVVVADLYRDPADPTIRLDVLVPIRRDPRDVASAPIAIAVLRIDARQFLIPFVGNWPVPSETAEALLVRREGRDVVYLSDLRSIPDAALNLRRPIDTPYLPAAMSLRGQHGVSEGIDYQGTAVLATSRRLPGSPWVLLGKIDQAEAFGPIRREAWQTGALIGALMLALVLAGGFFTWQRRNDFLRRALVAEQDRKALGERLALVTRHANDIIVLTDEDGHVVEANDRALAAYGYTLDEIRTLPPGGLRAPDTAGEQSAQVSLAGARDGVLAETTHRRKDGSTFPVEVSARSVSIGDRNLLFEVTRDISQRRQHEAEIRRLSRLYAAHSEVNQAIVRATTQEDLLNEVCRALVEAGGFAMAWIGWPARDGQPVSPMAQCGDRSGYLRTVLPPRDESRDGPGPVRRALQENRTVVCNDFLNAPDAGRRQEAARDAGVRSMMSLPVRHKAATAGALSVYATEAGFFGAREVALIEGAALDIAFGLDALERERQRVRAEADLARSEERLRLALTAGRQGLYDLDVETGEAATSPEYASMLGYDPDTFHETNAAWIERLHPDDRASVARHYDDYVSGRVPEYRVEFRSRTRDGAWKWILSVGRIVERTTDGGPRRMLGTHTDITELKQAEAAVAASELRYRRLFESAKDGILILDAVTGVVVEVNPYLVQLLGYPRDVITGKAIWELGFLRDIVANREAFAELQRVEYIRYEDKPLETSSGRRIDVEFISNLCIVDSSPVIQCNIRDISERREAEAALRASLREKEALLKEVHHRVKNNLQVIESLLRLEAGRSVDAAKSVLRDMQGRIHSMALLHETLYRSGNFARVNLADYLGQLANQLFRNLSVDTDSVHLRIEMESASVAAEQAIPCGLILNELLSNSLKHGFPDGRRGDVRLTLRRSDTGEIRLTVSDTGKGLSGDFAARRGNSLGLQIVTDLAVQLGGALEITNGTGVTATVRFTPRGSDGA